MKKTLAGIALSLVLAPALAADPDWPSDFESKVAARETARASVTTTASESSELAWNTMPASGEGRLQTTYAGVFLWWAAAVAGIEIDTDLQGGMILMFR